MSSIITWLARKILHDLRMYRRLKKLISGNKVMKNAEGNVWNTECTFNDLNQSVASFSRSFRSPNAVYVLLCTCAADLRYYYLRDTWQWQVIDFLRFATRRTNSITEIASRVVWIMDNGSTKFQISLKVFFLNWLTQIIPMIMATLNQKCSISEWSSRLQIESMRSPTVLAFQVTIFMQFSRMTIARHPRVTNYAHLLI